MAGYNAILVNKLFRLVKELPEAYFYTGKKINLSADKHILYSVIAVLSTIFCKSFCMAWDIVKYMGYRRSMQGILF